MPQSKVIEKNNFVYITAKFWNEKKVSMLCLNKNKKKPKEVVRCKSISFPASYNISKNQVKGTKQKSLNMTLRLGNAYRFI